jgi:hypothetical protein
MGERIKVRERAGVRVKGTLPLPLNLPSPPAGERIKVRGRAGVRVGLQVSDIFRPFARG